MLTGRIELHRSLPLKPGEIVQGNVLRRKSPQDCLSGDANFANINLRSGVYQTGNPDLQREMHLACIESDVAACH